MAGISFSSRLLILGCLALASPLPAQVFGGEPELKRVEFVGNRVFPDDSLRAAILNRQTECSSLMFQIIPLCPLGVGWVIDRRYFRPRQLSSDSVRLARYYYARGYREATIDTTLTEVGGDNGGEVALTFMVDEGRPVQIDTILVLGLDDFDDPAILSGLPLRVGDPLSVILLDATRDTLLFRLQNAGYAHADVLRGTFVPFESYDAEVEFDVAPGPLVRFGPIVFERDAGSVLSEDALRRMLPFDPGDRYSPQLVVEAQRNLYGLEIIRNASIEPHLDFQPDSLVPLTVSVVEEDVHRVRADVGWSTTDCLNTEALWASRNFLGSARRLQVRGRVSNLLATDFQDGCPQSGTGEFAKINWLASVELSFPWIFSTRNALSVSVFAERESLPDVFVRRAVGLSGELTRTLGPGTLLSVAYRPQFSSLEAAGLFFCTSFLICTPDDIETLEDNNWLSPLGMSLSRDRTNDLLNPSDGYKLLLDLEHASPLTGSNFAYNRAIAEASWYDQLARRTVWATRLRVGWVAGGEFGGLSLGGPGVIHPAKRFYGGGANSVRGFAQNRLGPRVLTASVEELVGYREDSEGNFFQACLPEAVEDRTCDPSVLGDGAFFPQPQGGTRLLESTVEYRWRAGNQLQAVLFTDVGQVWGENEPIRLDGFKISPGLGVRYFSPVGPVRIDLAYRFGGGDHLQVVTSDLRPYDPTIDSSLDWLQVQGIPEDGEVTVTAIPWIELPDLAVMDRRILFGESASFFQRLQLHFSIGQAF